MPLDITDIRLIVNIADSSSLTRGAARTYMSLSAASIRIKNAEEKLGTELFSRTSHGVKLTAAGQAFLHHGRLLLEQYESLQNDLQEYVKGSRGHLRIYANTLSIVEILPRALATFLVNYPNVTFDIRERTSADVVRAVNEGATDVGLIASGVPTGGLEVLSYRRERLVLAVGLAHPLAQLKEVGFTKTLDYDYVGLGEGASTRALLKQAADTVSRRIKMRIEVSNLEAMCRLIQSGIGIGVLPESAARRHAKTMAIQIVPLVDDWAPRDLQICVRNLKQLPTFAKKLVGLLISDGAGSMSPSTMLK